jgi:pullulanase
MHSFGSFTSPLLRLLAACCAAVAVTGCGAGSAETDPAPQSTRLLASVVSSAAPQAAGTIRMHYRRVQGDTSQWGVYSWDGPQNPSSAWITDRFMMSNTDSFGGYVDIPVNISKSAIWFLVTDGYGNKNCGNDQSANFNANIGSVGQEIWMLEGSCTVYASQPAISFGNLNNASAHWLSANTIAWPGVASSGSYKLYYAANGGLGSDPSGVTGADGSMLLTVGSALPDALKQKFPHLSGATALALSDSDAAGIAAKASFQFAVAQFDAGGKLVQVTSLQMAGMLDSVFAAAASSAKLGLSFNGAGVPTFRVWAPTARSVALNLYPDANAASTSQVAMQKDAASGVWSYTAPNAGWSNRYYYTYTVNVLSRWAGNSIVTNVVTDPYSLSLNANSGRSFIANLDSATLKPGGWDHQDIPKLEHPTDIALYELHIRDFSASDATVPAPHRGKYLAFTDTQSNGMRHLRSLQKAGMTHIHLLPSFDFASVNETGCSTPVIPNGAADSTAQQSAAAASQDSDCFNWGYDPVHYTAPEGSYSTNANDGAVRVREFRAMVQSLHEQGLRVTMDVVYNHTSQSQQGPLSVLDRIVPAYYYRLNASGGITNDSCCADTAAENAMMAKLMIDSVATWATQYKVDSFRFDIMGFTPLSVLTRLQSTVNQAAGRDIYLYGEAWNFGTVGNDARFVQARQANMFGTGIGSFNDRLRDAVRGGGCCDGGSSLISQQGFINGAWYDPNALANQSKDDLLRLADLVRVGLSGTLRDYRFTDRFGSLRKSSEIDYFGQPAGFTANPGETINYIEAHDNQTLFDLNAYKLPASTSIADRVRVQNLGAAINMLSQGVPFFHAGQEILRSKSMDRDSYNAGDWFNKLDYSYQSNNFGVGLPMASVNQDNWPLMAPILANPLIKPGMADIVAAKGYFTDLLAIRMDSSLFRLRTGQDVSDRLQFHNVGPQQVPGVIVMSIDGQHPTRYEGAKYKSVLVLFNVDKVAKTVTVAELKGRKLDIHKVHRQSDSEKLARTASYDSATGGFSIPPRTTVVFVENSANGGNDD